MKQKCLAMILMLSAILIAVSVSGCTTGTVTVSPTAAPAASLAGSALSSGLPDSSDYNITITGGSVSPVTVTYADLKAMNLVEMSNVTMVKMNGVDVTSDWVGVPLTDIMSKAGVPAGNVTFKIAAPDGFISLYTSDELDGAMIGLKKNGTVLVDQVSSDNPIQLVVPGQTGHLWIKVPVSIEIDTV
jgi:DMSO/TMAO reductase YedYZ molybdopterin-dependent catalytic subunit